MRHVGRTVRVQVLNSGGLFLRLPNVDDKNMHLFGFERLDGCEARLYFFCCELENTEARVI